MRLFAPAWALLEEGLAAALSDSLLRGYWADYMASAARGEPDVDAKDIQARTCRELIMRAECLLPSAKSGNCFREIYFRNSKILSAFILQKGRETGSSILGLWTAKQMSAKASQSRLCVVVSLSHRLHGTTAPVCNDISTDARHCQIMTPEVQL